MSQIYSKWAYWLSLAGGIIILLCGIVTSMWFLFGGSAWGDFGDMWSGMMGGYHGMMGSFGFPLGVMGGLSLVGLVSGIIVTISAVMLNMRPQEQRSWGWIIIIFSATSFLNMAGFALGAILGLVGGAFAVSSKNVNKQ